MIAVSEDASVNGNAKYICVFIVKKRLLPKDIEMVIHDGFSRLRFK